ncbi:hypothetical protein RLV_1202 (plasmid) [Rhizobium leguminosarum bv. viciae]|nr:hypothetical protein RLV_1202 [Rhizobium leguminosarum bv. viciae]
MSTDLPKARQRRPSAPHIGGSDGLSFPGGSLSKVKIGMLQMRNNGMRNFLCAQVAARAVTESFRPHPVSHIR